MRHAGSGCMRTGPQGGSALRSSLVVDRPCTVSDSVCAHGRSPATLLMHPCAPPAVPRLLQLALLQEAIASFPWPHPFVAGMAWSKSITHVMRLRVKCSGVNDATSQCSPLQPCLLRCCIYWCPAIIAILSQSPRATSSRECACALISKLPGNVVSWLPTALREECVATGDLDRVFYMSPTN